MNIIIFIISLYNKIKKMGRVKEIFIELQNQYGQNLEDAPVDFSMDDYLKMKADEANDDNEN